MATTPPGIASKFQKEERRRKEQYLLSGKQTSPKSVADFVGQNCDHHSYDGFRGQSVEVDMYCSSPQTKSATGDHCHQHSVALKCWAMWVLRRNEIKGYLYEKERQAFYFQVMTLPRKEDKPINC